MSVGATHKETHFGGKRLFGVLDTTWKRTERWRQLRAVEHKGQGKSQEERPGGKDGSPGKQERGIRPLYGRTVPKQMIALANQKTNQPGPKRDLQKKNQNGGEERKREKIGVRHWGGGVGEEKWVGGGGLKLGQSKSPKSNRWVIADRE